jgi:hypothetical protein
MEHFKTIELGRNYITNMKNVLPLLYTYQKKGIEININCLKYKTLISTFMPQPSSREGRERNSKILKNCVDAIEKTLFF